MSKRTEKIEVENINVPGRTERVDTTKYLAVRDALLSVFPRKSPGLTFAELQAQEKPLLPQDLFPDGAKSGWWLKTTQLDLEAKGIVEAIGVLHETVRLLNGTLNAAKSVRCGVVADALPC